MMIEIENNRIANNRQSHDANELEVCGKVIVGSEQ
jgi:hypothetical protein